jgi:hypothetical protein
MTTAAIILPVATAGRIGDDRARDRTNASADCCRANAAACEATDGRTGKTADDGTVTGTRAGRAASDHSAQGNEHNERRSLLHQSLLSM